MASIISAGTSTGSALNFTGDTSGSLALATNNGTTAVTINTSQYVGIGTDSPTALLHLYGTTAPAIQIGKSGDLGAGFQLGRDASTLNAFIIQRENADLFIRTNNTERMRISAAGLVGIGTSSPYKRLSVTQASSTAYSTTDFDRDYLALQLANTTNDVATGIYFAVGSNGEAAISAVETSDGETALTFGTRGSGSRPERMRIASDGNVYIGTSTAPSAGGTGVGFQMGISTASVPTITWRTNTNSASDAFYFYSLSYLAGYIRITSNTTSYVTTSDYRLKENVAPMVNALSKVDALKPVTYTWKQNGEASQGFIAHELAEVVPECVTGEKDEVDADGNIKPQGIDTSFLVATLTAAIQELKQIVDTQATEIAGLKAKVGA